MGAKIRIVVDYTTPPAHNEPRPRRNAAGRNSGAAAEWIANFQTASYITAIGEEVVMKGPSSVTATAVTIGSGLWLLIMLTLTGILPKFNPVADNTG
uniref:Uncharacterized protein n=1 Tax=Candidatus Kentrum eta TaxID=2126337 RepID=A0A450UIZ7_9GAMM|nr:MAG: hypothetical protein BECKH772A_GA0070896_1003115 [Candidatus Kentron sp. H]VFJ92493.1 MAG: hypothetical protein BECKH772B_GA0070898_1003016 [Candidatus Kentron sp. H]VFJ99277.1 MAG: hypothetical protein BECKH772C_GA0070978_1003015 [Candidatus Kentron sp. H]